MVCPLLRIPSLRPPLDVRFGLGDLRQPVFPPFQLRRQVDLHRPRTLDRRRPRQQRPHSRLSLRLQSIDERNRQASGVEDVQHVG